MLDESSYYDEDEEEGEEEEVDEKYVKVSSTNPSWNNHDDDDDEEEAEEDEWPEKEFNLQKKIIHELPKFEFWYLVTGRASLRLIQAVSSLMAFCLVAWVNAFFVPTYIVQATLLSAFAGSSFFLVIYSANIIRTTKIRWIFHELIFTGLGGYMLGISTLIMGYSALRWQHSAWIVSVLFCSFSFLAFLADFGSMISIHQKHPHSRHHDFKRIRDLSSSSLSHSSLHSFQSIPSPNKKAATTNH